MESRCGGPQRLFSCTPPAGQSSSVAITLPEEPCGNQAGLGRFTGGGSQVRVGGARVTRGLTIHCDLVLSNNLEVNWGGDKFHLTEHTKPHLCQNHRAMQARSGVGVP
jgi:hypothetical protein